MKKKKKLPENEIVDVINNVANRLASRFKFGYHELEDMKQQARLFAWEAMSNYDGVRPLENFLWTHVRNRLFNFKRDKYERPGKPCLACDHYIYDNIGGDTCSKYSVKDECSMYNHWCKRNQRKKNIMNPVDITCIDDEHENNMKLLGDEPMINYKEMLEIIDRELPLSLRPLFLRLKFGNKLTKIQKIKVQIAVQDILIAHGYDEHHY